MSPRRLSFIAASDHLQPLLAELSEFRAASTGRPRGHCVEPRVHSASWPRSDVNTMSSRLASHPTERGRGLGMRLLAENLARIDEHSMPAYLESSNPANVGRYERVGFRPVGSFSTPDDSHTVTTMWRRPRPDKG